MTGQEFKAVVAELLSCGWEMRAPDAEAQRADEQACTNSACLGCGKKDLCYMPFVGPSRPKPGAILSRYRAFAVCARCGRADEF